MTENVLMIHGPLLNPVWFFFHFYLVHPCLCFSLLPFCAISFLTAPFSLTIQIFFLQSLQFSLSCFLAARAGNDCGAIPARFTREVNP